VSDRQHIVIAGGGMVGLSLALLLDRLLPPAVRLTLVEGVALPPAGAPTAASGAPTDPLADRRAKNINRFQASPDQREAPDSR